MPDPKFLAELKKAGLTIDQFMKMTPRQRLHADIGKGRDWREGWMGDRGTPSHPEMPNVTTGFHKNVPAPPAEDEEVTM
jgi:hypothetical protein